MSGRLVILRHKSWNVWNQDNQEKVLRDERLNREQLEAESSTKKKKLSDSVYSSLSGERGISFVESQTDSVKNNTDDKAKPKSDKALEDWKLGDGSRELGKFVPWYERKSSQQEGTVEIDHDGKKSLDPMSMFFSQHGVNESKDEPKHEDALNDDYYEVSISDASNSSTREFHHVKLKKRTKKEKKSKKAKRKKEKPADYNIPYMTYDSNQLDIEQLESLRRKRLKRESDERKRELILLAEKDIFG